MGISKFELDFIMAHLVNGDFINAEIMASDAGMSTNEFELLKNMVQLINTNQASLADLAKGLTYLVNTVEQKACA